MALGVVAAGVQTQRLRALMDQRRTSIMNPVYNGTRDAPAAHLARASSAEKIPPRRSPESHDRAPQKARESRASTVQITVFQTIRPLHPHAASQSLRRARLSYSSQSRRQRDAAAAYPQ